MKLIPRYKSISFITIYINFASSNPQHFHEVDKYIENFEYVTDDISVPKDLATEKAFIGDYFESPRRNVLKNNDEEYEAIRREYLKELEEHKASELNKIDEAAKEIKTANVLRKSHGRYADNRLLSRVCGADKTETPGVIEGPDNIESFPWLGVLIYSRGKVRLITTVILVTINTVIGSARDIERLPKLDFRKKSKVILGQTCKHPGINVLDYNYHPDYGKETFSSIVLVQIDLASVSQALWPICGPPKVLKVSKFYTITLPNDCRKSRVEIFLMEYVKPEVCKHYYRQTGLDLGSIWPKHGACGKARTEDECVWRNGAALVVKQRGRWHLMGIGVNGPGCAAPSRYVDYAAYSGWVTNSVARIGRPALTRLADNHLILRRTIDKIQRYGPCDANEVQTELFCDRTNTTAGERLLGRVRYNLTLIEKYDYTCIALKANSRYKRPKISLKGVCDSPHHICYSANRFVLDFYIEIAFFKEVWFKICVYGKLIASPDPKGALKYFNGKKPPVLIPWGLTPTGELLDDTDHPPFGHGLTSHAPPVTSPESTGDEFGTTTPFIPKDISSSSVTPPAFTGDEFSTITSTVVPQDSESTYPSLPEFTGDIESTYPSLPEFTGEFSTVTPVVSQDNDSTYPSLPEFPGEFWTVTPVVSQDNESTYPSLPEVTGEFWTVTPVVAKDNESLSPTPPEPTGEFWTVTPIVAKDHGSSYPAPLEPTGDFWSVTPIWPKDTESPYPTLPEPPIWPKNSESPYPTIPEPTGEFWSVTPIWPKDTESPYPTLPEPPIWPKDSESPYPTIPEPTGEFWSVTPIWPKDTESPYPTLPEPPIWPKDSESPYPTIPEPTGEFWSVTPIWPKDTESPYPTLPEPPIWPKDSESPYPTIPEPTDEFWSVTPIRPKDTKSPYPTLPEPPVWPKDSESPYPTISEPTKEFWSVTPISPKYTESPYPTLPEPTGEFWSVTPIWPKVSESPYPTLPEHTGEFWNVTPKWPQDTKSLYPTIPEPTVEFWSITPIWPNRTKTSSHTPPDVTGEFWSVTPKWPEDTDAPYPTLPELTEDFWSVTPIWPYRTKTSHTPPDVTGEFWSVTPKWPEDTESPYPTLPEPPIWPKDSESPYPTIPEHTGEFWSVTPKWPQDTESPYPILPEPTGEFWSVTPILTKNTESPYYTLLEPTGEFSSVTPIWPKDTELPYPSPPDATGESRSVVPVMPADDESSSVTPMEPTVLVQPKDDDSSLATPTEPIGDFWSITPFTPTDDESVIPEKTIAIDDLLNILSNRPTSESWRLTTAEPKGEESPFGMPMDTTGEFMSLSSILFTKVSSSISMKPNDDETYSATPVEPTGKFWSLIPAEPEDKMSSNGAPIYSTGDFLSLSPVIPTDVESALPVKPVAPDDSLPETAIPIQPTSEYWSLKPAESIDGKSSFGTPTETTGELWSLPSISFTDDEETTKTVESASELWTLFTDDKFSPLTKIKPKYDKTSFATPFEPTDTFFSLIPSDSRDKESSNGAPIDPTSEFLSLTPVIPTDDDSYLATPIEPIGDFWSITPVKPTDAESVIPVNPITPDESLSLNVIPIQPSSESSSITPTKAIDEKTSFGTPAETTGEFWSLKPSKSESEESSYDPTGEFWSLTPLTIVIEDDNFFSMIPLEPTVAIYPQDDDSLSVIPIEKPDNHEDGISIFSANPVKHTDISTPVTPKGIEVVTVLQMELHRPYFNLTPVLYKDKNITFVTTAEHVDDFLSLNTIFPKKKESESVIPNKLTTKSSVRPITHKYTATFAEPVEPTVPGKPGDHELISHAPPETTEEFWSLMPVRPTVSDSLNNFELPLPIDPEPTSEWNSTPVMIKGEKSSPTIQLPDDTDESYNVEPTAHVPDEKYTIAIASSVIITFTDQTAPSPDKITSFTEDPLQPWWIEFPLATTNSFIKTGRDEQTPNIIGVTDNVYDSYQPWWTEVANTEETGAEDVSTKEQETLWSPANKVTDKDTKVNLWVITPLNKVPGDFMTYDGEVLLVTPEDTAQEEKVTSLNEPENSEEFHMFWAVTQVSTDLFRNDTNRHSSKVAKPHRLLGIVTEKPENRWNTEESVVKKKNQSNSKKLQTIRPKYVNTLFGTRKPFKNKMKYESAKTAKYPLDPDEVNQLEKLEKTFEDIIDEPLFTLQRVKQKKKFDVIPAKTRYSKKDKSFNKNKLKSNDILAITLVSMPEELQMMTAKIASSEEDNRGGVLRMSNFKRFNGDRIVTPHLLSSESYRQPIYLRNLVTRRQSMTQKSGLQIRQPVIKWKRPRRPGGFM